MWRNSCSWLFLPPDGKHPPSQSFYLRLCLLLTERKLDVFSLTGRLKVGLYWPPVVSHLNSLRWFSNCTPGWVSTLWHHFYYRCNVAHATAPGRSEVKVTEAACWWTSERQTVTLPGEVADPALISMIETENVFQPNKRQKRKACYRHGTDNRESNSSQAVVLLVRLHTLRSQLCAWWFIKADV